MLSILPAPHQTHRSPQPTEVLRTDEGEEVHQCISVSLDLDSIQGGKLRRTSSSTFQTFDIHSIQRRHRCH
jgi:hypothetical protein